MIFNLCSVGKKAESLFSLFLFLIFFAKK
jgi:hypothetical protein